MSETAKHTAGPYYYDDNGSIREESSDAVIAHTSNGGHINPDIIIFDEATQAANMKFLAAAPDMAEALRLISEAVKPIPGGTLFQYNDAVMQIARAALTKAGVE